jgi:hypothetical protein
MLPDVADTLSPFMVNGQPDPARFQKVAGNQVAAAAKASKGERRGLSFPFEQKTAAMF